jgi:hypothetical protein
MYAEIAFGLLSLYSGWQSAQSKKAGSLGQADEYDQTALETKLTRKFNETEYNKKVYQDKIMTMQQGLDKAGMLGLRGLKTVENMRAEGGGSGAALGAGTTTEVLVNQHIQNSSQQLAVMQGTKEKLTNIQQNAISINKMEDYKAKMRIAQLTRAADSIRSGVDSAFFAGMLGAFTNAVGSYKMAGGDFNDDKDSGWYDTWS